MLELFGWDPIDPILFTKLSQLKKAIFLFPHTTHWDLVTLLAYVLHYRQFQGKFWVTVDKTLPNKFPGNLMFPKYFKPLCTSYSLEAGNKDKSGAGFIKQAVEQLKSEDQYWLLLNPEGKREKSKWRSGWYALAKELQIPIVVIGLDFTQHYMKCPLVVNPDWNSIINEGSGKVEYFNPERYENDIGQIPNSNQVSDKSNGISQISTSSTNDSINKITMSNSNQNKTIQVSIDDSKSEIEKLLQAGMGQIVPLYPELSHVPIREYQGCPGVVSSTQKEIYVVAVIILVILVALLIICALKRYGY